MVRAMAGCLAAVLLVATAARAEGEFTNMLVNSSFESGRVKPDYWNGFGLGFRGWEFGGRDGERCVSIEGSGMDAGWWYPESWTRVQRSRLYHLSYWVRSGSATDEGRVFAGLNLVNRAGSAGASWERKEFFFRAPERLPDLQLRVGQDHLRGKVYFDKVELHPAVVTNRSRGTGNFLLGAGESIEDGVYTAVHDMSGDATSDARFLHHFSGRFDTDRWILEGLDEVVYRHVVNRLGMPQRGEVMRAAPVAGETVYVGLRQTVAGGPDEVVREDPRSVRALRQEEATIALVVGRCEGSRLGVEVSQNGKVWRRIGEIDRPGPAEFTVPARLLPAREVWVRLKSEYAGRIEIGGYRYTSTLEGVGVESAVVGASQYLALLYTAPDVGVFLTDVGDLVPAGRCAVKAIIENRGDERRLRATAIIKKDDEVLCESEDIFRIEAEGARRVYLPYTVESGGEQVLRIALSDADSGKLVSLLEGRFVVPVLEGGPTCAGPGASCRPADVQ